MDLKAKNRAALCDGFFIVGTVLLLLFSLWKARYGLGAYDESFYLTIPYRMCHGDKLFLNEWNLSQLSALLQYPLMKLYLLLNSSCTDGIVLAFRRIYVSVNFAAGLLAYYRLRKYGAGAVAAVLLYLLYAPYNIMALSYNTIGLLCGFLCAIFLATAARNSDYVVAGLFFAGLVLCQPLMLAEFAVVYLVLICLSLTLKRRELLRRLLWFLLGCVILAIPVLVYFVFSVGISNVIAALPLIMSDPEHDTNTLLSLYNVCYSTSYCFLPNYLLSLPTGIEFHTRPLFAALYFAFIPLWAVVFLDRGRGKRAALYLSLSALLCVSIGAVYTVLYLYESLTYTSYSYMNFVLFPWLFHGVCLFPLLTKPDERRTLVLFYALGFLHMVSFLASNQTGYVFSIALLPSCLVSIMLSIKYCSSLTRTKGVPVFICTAVSAVLLLFLRANYCFVSPSVGALDTQCSSGPTAGIFLSSEHAERLEKVVVCVKEKQLRPDKNTLFLAPDSQFYLCSDTGLAQFSAWMPFYMDSTQARLEAYYALNPDKCPDAILIEKDPILFANLIDDLDDDAVPNWAAEHGFSFEEDDVCIFMRKLTD